MDREKQPSLNVKKISLTKCIFENEAWEKIPMRIVPEFKYGFSIKGDVGSCELTLLTKDVSIDEQKVLFSCEVSYRGDFCVNNDMPNAQLEEFFQYYAAELLVPHIRETLSSLTIKSDIGPILLLPLNIISLLKADQ